MDKNLFTNLRAVQALLVHWEELKGTHMRKLLEDSKRNQRMLVETDHMMFDYSHEHMTEQTLDMLKELAVEAKVPEKIAAMFAGETINKSEGRAVMHMALRAAKATAIPVASIDKDGRPLPKTDVLPEVRQTLEKVFTFATQVREGKFRGFSGKPLTSFVAIGIGGSYLGIDFVYESIRHHPECKKQGQGFSLYFIPNVDPIDFVRVTEGLNHEETLFIVNSKTFTTPETMLNARTCRNWLFERYAAKITNVAESQKAIVKQHMCAVSTALKLTDEFGIDRANVFEFWDWVGGRYSVWSAIGALPLTLCFGVDIVKQFLAGGEFMDEHFSRTTEIEKNLPVLLGLIGFYNTHIQKLSTRAILPYSQCLHKFVPHIQQVAMESNGKDVSLEGVPLAEPTGPVVFGEPGTNGQHSFYQLIHQGRKVAAEFIGYHREVHPIDHKDEKVSNHDELMCNFFAQPDALARGIRLEELSEQVRSKPPYGIYNLFEGNRPSLSLLIDELTPFTVGQLLALYEHRTAVEGFLFNINSWDQMGVELGSVFLELALGKVLAKDVRELLGDFKRSHDLTKLHFERLPSASHPTIRLIKEYIAKKPPPS